MSIQNLFASISQQRRIERRKAFETLVLIEPHWRILDIGCGENFRSPWFSPELDVIGLDYRPIPPSQCAYGKFVCGDASQLPFLDKYFDLAFSNSLIEHLPSREHQRSFASEIRRVSKRFWVQTPNTDFPVDPHYLIPFFQHLPRGIQEFGARHLSGSILLGGYCITQGFDVPKEKRKFETVLGLSGRSLQKLFPSARILHQRFAGLSQSIVAFAA